MPITAEQRAERKTRLFASDLAAIFGVDPRRTAVDVWAEKTMDLEPGNGDPAWFDLGNRLEPLLLEWAAESLGPLNINVTALHPTIPLGAHLDADRELSGEPVEATTAGIGSPFGDQDQFGDYGTDAVPYRKLLQGHAQMICHRKDPQVCHYPVMLGGRGLGMFRVPRDRDLCTLIEDTVPAWWERHVTKGERPDPRTPISLDILKRVRREPETVAEVPPELIVTLVAAKTIAKLAAKEEEEAKAAILEALGGAEATQIDPTAGGFTFFSHQRSTVHLDTLRADYPDIAEQCTVAKPVRTLRYKKPPK